MLRTMQQQTPSSFVYHLYLQTACETNSLRNNSLWKNKSQCITRLGYSLLHSSLIRTPFNLMRRGICTSCMGIAGATTLIHLFLRIHAPTTTVTITVIHMLSFEPSWEKNNKVISNVSAIMQLSFTLEASKQLCQTSITVLAVWTN
jgi:hypothetical protein